MGYEDKRSGDHSIKCRSRICARLGSEEAPGLNATPEFKALMNTLNQKIPQKITNLIALDRPLPL